MGKRSRALRKSGEIKFINGNDLPHLISDQMNEGCREYTSSVEVKNRTAILSILKAVNKGGLDD